MKKTFLIISIILFWTSSNAQSGFIFRYSSPDDKIPSAITETPDHGFIIASSFGTYASIHNTLLFRLNKHGDTLKTKKLINPYGGCSISNLLKLPGGFFLGVGAQTFPSGQNRLWLLILSDSLKIIKDTSFNFGLQIVSSNFGFLDHSNNLIVYGCGQTDSLKIASHPFIWLLSPNLDSLKYSYYNDSTHSQHVYSMIEKSDTTGYFMMLTGKYLINTSSYSQILTIDLSLNVTKIDSMPGKLALYLNSKVLNKDEILICGKRDYPSLSPRTDKIGILKIDKSFLINESYFLGPDDTITYPSVFNNLDFTDPNKIYCAGTVNVNIGAVFSTIPSSIIIGKFDTSLNLLWQRYFGGDQYYVVYTMVATSDGGCIIGSTSFDYTKQNQERDLQFIKIDSNGLINGQNDLPKITKFKTVLYPNPGKDWVCINTALTEAELILYDLTGREIYSQSLVIGRGPMNVQKFKHGLYIYKILQNYEVRECGKWIKL